MLKDIVKDFRKKGALWLMPALVKGVEAGMRPHHHYKVECVGPDGRLKWTDEFDNTNPTGGLNAYLSNTLYQVAGAVLWYVGLIGATETDASMNGSTAALTIGTANLVAADAGSAIIVRGAGASGADLVTTILTYTSTTQATLNANSATAVSGAAVAWGPRAADVMNSHAPWLESSIYSNANRPAWTPNGAVSGASVSNSSSPASFSINAQAPLMGAFLASNNSKGGTTGTLLGMGLFSGGSKLPSSGDTVNVTITCAMT